LRAPPRKTTSTSDSEKEILVMNYTFSKAEQETHISWDAESKTASIYSAHPATIRKLDTLCRDYPEEYRCVWADSKYTAKKYETGAKYISFRKPASRKQKEAALKNLAKNSEPA